MGGHGSTQHSGISDSEPPALGFQEGGEYAGEKGREVGIKHGDTMRAPECSHKGCLIYRTGKRAGARLTPGFEARVDPCCGNSRRFSWPL